MVAFSQKVRSASSATTLQVQSAKALGRLSAIHGRTAWTPCGCWSVSDPNSSFTERRMYPKPTGRTDG
jgi:hypothetical protein